MTKMSSVRRGRQSSVTGGEKGRDFEKPFSRKTFLQGIAALVVILSWASWVAFALFAFGGCGIGAPGRGARWVTAYSVTGEPGRAAAVCTRTGEIDVGEEEGDTGRLGERGEKGVLPSLQGGHAAGQATAPPPPAPRHTRARGRAPGKVPGWWSSKFERAKGTDCSR